MKSYLRAPADFRKSVKGKGSVASPIVCIHVCIYIYIYIYTHVHASKPNDATNPMW